MIGAPNTQGQKYWVGIVQWAPETLVSEEIAMPRVETQGSENEEESKQRC